jgi:hypothetical protein
VGAEHRGGRRAAALVVVAPVRGGGNGCGWIDVSRTSSMDTAWRACGRTHVRIVIHTSTVTAGGNRVDGQTNMRGQVRSGQVESGQVEYPGRSIEEMNHSRERQESQDERGLSVRGRESESIPPHPPLLEPPEMKRRKQI